MKLTATLSTLLTFLLAASGPSRLNGQTSPTQPRIHQSVDDSRRVVLKGQTSALGLRGADQGAVPDDMPMERIMLMLKRTPEQQQALDAFLDELQDQSSPNFHQWIDAQEFGRRFGPADQDVQIVSAWLLSHGFQIDDVAASRMFIQFSGAAGRLREAFHTAIHHVNVNGARHVSNLSDPEIPEALAPVVGGFVSLNDFRPQSASVVSPQFNLPNGGGHALSPADFAAIYNLKPLYAAGITGAGSTIAVVGVARINMNNVTNFRKTFNLPANNPIAILAGTDPGAFQPLTNEDPAKGPDQLEPTLDLIWSGAVAPNATVKYVFAGDTSTTSGIFTATEYAIENKNKDVNADVLSVSYSACENQYPSAASAFNLMAQQAVTNGITIVAATGDTGSANCDSGSETTAVNGLAVSYMASVPTVVGVGGTQFNDAADPAKYWSTSGLVLGYVPEQAWNQSCPKDQCSDPNIAAGGGGISTLYTKPSWQSGVTGVPSANHRYVPDVALSASSAIDPYIICLDNDCDGNSAYHAIGGTSAATPSFSGILALVKQKVGKLGQVNAVLYGLAAKEKYASCNASPNSSASAPASTCVFNDITAGNNSVPGRSGYSAGVGYDVATGLGSVNAYNLATQWTSAKYSPSTITLSISPTTIPAGGNATVNVTVKPASGSGTPTGTVKLNLSTGQSLPTLTLGSGVATETLTGWPEGTYTVTAEYSGDDAYSPSNSTAVTVTAEAAVQNLQPEITSVTPGQVTLGQVASMTVTGKNFQPGLAVYIYINGNYTAMQSPIVSSTQVKFEVEFTGNPVTADVVIVNPDQLYAYAGFEVIQ